MRKDCSPAKPEMNHPFLCVSLCRACSTLQLCHFTVYVYFVTFASGYICGFFFGFVAVQGAPCMHFSLAERQLATTCEDREEDDWVVKLYIIAPSDCFI